MGQFRRTNSAGSSFNEQANDYNVTGIAYDKNGNIMALDRRGVVNSSNGIGDMDKLIYDYGVGNKLMDVTDSGSTSYGFVGSHPGNDYDYDANGNMTRDLNKGIGTSAVNGITYNYLNLPTEVKFNNSNTKKINYIYDATGNKLEKKVTEGSSIIRTYYAGSYVYEYVSGHVEELKFFSHPEGYAEVRNRGADPGGDPWNPPVPDFDYVFQYKDHLGNVRLSYKKNSNGINGIGSTSEVFFEDFESASGWDSEGAKYGTSLVYNGEHTRSGDYAGVLSRTNDADIYSHSNTWIDIDNSVPTRYDFSGWVYAEDVSGNTSRCKIMLFMNEEGETEYYTLVAESTSTYLVGQWVYLKGSYIVPPNIKKINLRVDMHSGGGAGTAWFDDLSIHRVNAAEIVAENHYYPFGLEHKGYNKSNITSSNIALKRKFGENEHQDELGLDWYDITARNYDPALGRWMNVDPLAEQFSSWSPYNYAFNNPIRYIDPDGRMAVEHIDVEKNKDGTYTVVGGEANSDKNIYVVDGSGNRTGEVVGEMLTEYSFHHEDGSAVVGTNINLNDQSGQNFFNDEIQNIGLFEYIKNAKGTEPLDFKHRGMNDRNEGTTVSQHHYRGMSFNGKVASARDIGNYAAGYVAGKSGFGWGASRVAFDALESYQKGGFATEGQPTQQAQRAGHNVGYPIFKQQQLNRQLERAKNPWLNRSKW